MSIRNSVNSMILSGKNQMTFEYKISTKDLLEMYGLKTKNGKVEKINKVGGE